MPHPSTIRDSDIAIIGMACRFPGAPDIDAFWRNLRDGVESIRRFSDDELRAAGIEADVLADPHYVRAGAVLDGVELFDPAFFGMSPREAEVMDPQHRLFLECSWQALEFAGYAGASPGHVGVYAGAGMSSYLLNNLYANRDRLASMGSFAILTANQNDFLASLAAYRLNLKGPAVSVQTACSTSLVAIHFAAQALLNGECDMALAGGVSVRTPQINGYRFQPDMIFSPDGHCRPFDAAARGTLSGSGAGVVLLKRLRDALEDGDSIHAVLKASAVNNDGADKMGFVAPSVAGQCAVIAEAIALAELNPESIGYVEAHGTATPMGDPIEVAALTRAFRAHTSRTAFCALGSVKSNFGHLDAAAGIAGFLKTVLALKHGQVPPSLHFEQPNPEIDFDASPFFVARSLQPWPASSAPRRAGVSSFGIGGTNAHVILEQPPAAVPSSREAGPFLFTVSAKTASSLENTCAALAAHLHSGEQEMNPADAAFTLSRGRKAFPLRRFAVAESSAQAASMLQAPAPAVSGPARPFVAFLFSGQGTQYAGMGAELYQREPEFRRAFDACSAILDPLLSIRLADVVFDTAPGSDATLRQTAIAQPALFAVEYALAQLWMSWGVKPDALLGHSIGEIVAATLAGVFSFEDGLRIAANRGRLMQQCAPGAMLAVAASPARLQPLLTPDLSIAAINGPAATVLSGAAAAIDAAEARLGREGVGYLRLHTSHAFHSQRMEPAINGLAQLVRGMRLNPPRIPVLSNLTGGWLSPEDATSAEYWTGQMRNPVLFDSNLAQLYARGGNVLIEMGPGNVLASLSQRHPDRPREAVVAASLPAARGRKSETASLLNALGKVWSAGIGVDWAAFYSGQQRRRVPLPSYAFDRQRCWIDARPSPSAKIDLPAAGLDLADYFYLPSWKRSALAAKEPAQTDSGPWLLFLDSVGFGQLLSDRLRAVGHTVVTVEPADSFRQLAADAYTLRPSEPRDYDLLVDSLRATNRIPAHIVHLWSITEIATDAETIDNASRTLDLSFYSLLELAAAMGRGRITARMQLSVVSNNTHDVTGDELLQPVKSALLGAVKVIPLEFPNLICRSIDFAGSSAEACDFLYGELAAGAADRVVAWRGRHRWIQIFDAARIEACPEKSRLRDDGVYLITGASGGMGAALAADLAQNPRRRLVLISRSADAANLAFNGPSERIAVYPADVGDAAAMRSALEDARRRFGPVNGIFHCAGIADDEGAIFHRTRQGTEHVLAAKVQGTLVLSELVDARHLDFFVLCSSLGSILYHTKFGQVGYAAANEFLDAFAPFNTSRRGVFTVSINWDDWKEAGMSVKARSRSQMAPLMRESLHLQKLGLTTQQGVEVFHRVLAQPFTRVAVSAVDLHALTELDAQLATGALREPATMHPRPEIAVPYTAPANETEERLAAIWQETLGIDRVGTDDSFLDLGGNSLLAIQIVTRVREEMHVDLSLPSLFEEQTIAAMSRRIAEADQCRVAYEAGEI